MRNRDESSRVRRHDARSDECRVATSPAAALALDIYHDVLDAVRADRLTLRALRLEAGTLHVGAWNAALAGIRRIVVLGAGKASVGMAAAAESVLGDRIAEGVVVTKREEGQEEGRTAGQTAPMPALPRIRVLTAAHPVPDETSVDAGRAILETARRTGPGDLVLFLLSGGASALMELPAPGIALADLRATTDLLLRAGAPIGDLNAVRACLSQLKAGGIARACRSAGAQLVCLVLSDVLGSPLDVIGSGPCLDIAPDPGAALRVLEHYGLSDRVPASVLAELETLNHEDTKARRGHEGEPTWARTELEPSENPVAAGGVAAQGWERHVGQPVDASTRWPAGPTTQRPIEPNTEHRTPTTDHRTPNTEHVVIGDIWTALDAAREAAMRRGLRPVVLTGSLDGEAREAGRVLGAIARDLPRAAAETGIDCWIVGGETTVTVRGSGRGGRSQELAAAAARAIAGVDGVSVLAAGTDGTDGPTDAAGAVVDGRTALRAAAAGADLDAALRDNDTYGWLDVAGALIRTGPTYSNVGDVVLIVPQSDPGASGSGATHL